MESLFLSDEEFFWLLFSVISLLFSPDLLGKSGLKGYNAKVIGIQQVGMRLNITCKVISGFFLELS